MSADPCLVAGQPKTVESSTQRMPLGSRVWHHISGIPAEYIYVQAGAEGLTVGQVAIFDAAYETTLLDQNGTATDVGPVGVALGTVTATYYGWLQIAGPSTVACLADITSGAKVYSSVTAGSVDDTASDGDQVIGMRFSAAEAASGGDGFVTVDLNYPWAGLYDSHV